ncbi:MAG: hypothetical protein ACOYCB_00195 [Fastidiosipilaceae bacterium]|nr:hypothetical protein [Clostridiaceae bacterium]
MLNLVFIIASLLSLAVALSQFWRQRDFEYSCAQAKRRQRARQQGKGQEMLSDKAVRHPNEIIGKRPREVIFYELDAAAFAPSLIKNEPLNIIQAVQEQSESVAISNYEHVA